MPYNNSNNHQTKTCFYLLERIVMQARIVIEYSIQS